ncbi:hypothetical protein [Novosphingobium sp.]|uniref:hypothetical protein n=1 Tax=Novosphingobium sp. TaxID=1874826 RepID=UPI003340F560
MNHQIWVDEQQASVHITVIDDIESIIMHDGDETLTRHAEIRMIHRAIPPIAVALLEEYGSEIRHNGADILFMDKAAKRRLARAFGGRRALRLLEPVLNSYAVIADGYVLTVATKTKRFRRDSN